MSVEATPAVKTYTEAELAHFKSLGKQYPVEKLKHWVVDGEENFVAPAGWLAGPSVGIFASQVLKKPDGDYRIGISPTNRGMLIDGTAKQFNVSYGQAAANMRIVVLRDRQNYPNAYQAYLNPDALRA